MASLRRLLPVALTATLAGCGVHAGLASRPSGSLAARATASGAVAAPDLVEVVSPNFNDRPAEIQKPDCIVWHHTASKASALATAKYFQSPEAQVSSHYIVDRTGEVYRCVGDARRAWHAGPSIFQGRKNVNDFSIGIEICNLGDNSETYARAQVTAVAHLTAWLMASYGMELPAITRHRDVAIPLGRKNDTSDNFPANEALDQVQAFLSGQAVPYPSPPLPSQGLDPGKGYRLVVAPLSGTWSDLADALLDSPFRGDELRYLNPGMGRSVEGATVKVPVDYRFFDMLHPRQLLLPLHRN